MEFKDLQLKKLILKAIAEQNYKNPTPIQQQAIPIILEKKDVIASAKTGTGKTAAFALPLINFLLGTQDIPSGKKKIKVLVITPTRELALQINENFKTYGIYTNIKNTVVFGGTSIKPQIDVLKKGVDILIATPGRLLDLHKQDEVNLDYIEHLVLDEADLLLEMGFINDIRKIERLCPNNKQTLLFSATIPQNIQDLAQEILKNPKVINDSQNSLASENIEEYLYFVPKPKKIELCLHLLRNRVKNADVIIFRRTKFGVEKLEKSLIKNGYSTSTIHGDKSQSERQKALNQFKNKEVSILIATDVASRGLDISSLDFVINFDLPNIPEIYIHRIGRTGRADKKGIALSFCSADEKEYIKKIEENLQQTIEVVDEHPYPLDPKAKPIIHKKKGSKYKNGRKSEASKKKKKRWY